MFFYYCTIIFSEIKLLTYLIQGRTLLRDDQDLKRGGDIEKGGGSNTKGGGFRPLCLLSDYRNRKILSGST